MKAATREQAARAHRVLAKQRLSLSVAESCTGGLLSHLLTSLPGSSAFFVAGIIAYDEATKTTLLGIPDEVMQCYGAVSAETARTMAEGVRLMTGTHLGLATTGNLGPSALDGKDLGLVYLAASCNRETVVREIHLSGDREANREEAAAKALSLLAEIAETL